MVSLIELLITWIWFLILGFRASKTWGISILLFFPITPFMFAFRFTRKARKAIHYYGVTLIFFSIINAYIIFFKPNFYENSSATLTQINEIATRIQQTTSVNFGEFFSTITDETGENEEEIDIRILPPIKSPAMKKVTPRPVRQVLFPIAKPYSYYKKKPSKTIPKPKKQPRYKTVSIHEIGHYMTKKVLITTSVIQHKGRLISVTSSTVSIQKQTSGGSVTMPIQKNKIKHIKVYL
jgi:hypothetical protein